MVGIARLSVSGLPLLDDVPHQGVFSVGERGHRLTERRPPFLGGVEHLVRSRTPTHASQIESWIGWVDGQTSLLVRHRSSPERCWIEADRGSTLGCFVRRRYLIAVLIAVGMFILLVSQQSPT